MNVNRISDNVNDIEKLKENYEKIINENIIFILD